MTTRSVWFLQFDFQHAVAVLLDRSAFIQEPHPLKAYSGKFALLGGSSSRTSFSQKPRCCACRGHPMLVSDIKSLPVTEYLRSVYEALLLVNGIDLADLQVCAQADMGHSDATAVAVTATRRLYQSAPKYDTDDLISEGNLDLPRSKKDKGHAASAPADGAPQPVPVAEARVVDCVKDVGYNVVLRPQYMMLVPRGQKDYQGKVNVNSFGKACWDVVVCSCAGGQECACTSRWLIATWVWGLSALSPLRC
jgi:hypothetical protein